MIPGWVPSTPLRIYHIPTSAPSVSAWGELILKRYWVGLLATSASWFPYDFIVYPVRPPLPVLTPLSVWVLISVRSSVRTLQPSSTTSPVGVTPFLPSSLGVSSSSEYTPTSVHCYPPHQTAYHFSKQCFLRTWSKQTPRCRDVRTTGGFTLGSRNLASKVHHVRNRPWDARVITDQLKESELDFNSMKFGRPTRMAENLSGVWNCN